MLFDKVEPVASVLGGNAELEVTTYIGSSIP